jgi:hypothetical protein
MLNDKELRIQQAIISIQRRLMKSSRGQLRIQLRGSCGWATDEEFQRILDSVVAGGIAVRVKGARGAELYRSAVEVKP